VVWPTGRSDNLVISVDLAGRLNYFSQGTSQPIRTIDGHQKNITAVGVSPTSQPTLYTGSYEGRVRSWDLSSGTASSIAGNSHTGQVTSVASTSGHIYTTGWDDTLRSIDTSSNTFAGSASSLSGQPTGSSIAHTNDGAILVTTDKGVDLFSSSGEKSGEFPTKGYTTTCIAASKSDDLIAVGCSDRTVRFFTSSNASITENSSLKITGLTGPPSTLAFSPSSSLLAVGLASGGISVYNTSDASLLTSRWSAHTSRVTSISWRGDSEWAVSGGLDTNVFVWSVKNPGKRIRAMGAHKEGVNGVVWVEGGKDGEKVVSVGADAAVKSWTVAGLS
jgi:WD40 repeat protein